MRLNDTNDDSNESEQKEEKNRKRLNRRDFITTAGAGLCAGGIGLALLGTIRAGVPTVLPDPSAQFKIGYPGDYVAGTVKDYDEQKVFVFSDDEGLFAISAVCTHLGCVVAFDGSSFQCPCHGSRFAADGKVIQGPAPQPLPWFEVSKRPDGQLVVDRGRPVKIGTKYKLET